MSLISSLYILSLCISLVPRRYIGRAITCSSVHPLERDNKWPAEKFYKCVAAFYPCTTAVEELSEESSGILAKMHTSVNWNEGPSVGITPYDILKF